MENTKIELQLLYKHLVKQEQWDVTLEEPSASRPYDVLMVKMYETVDGRSIYWQAELSFLPGLEKDIVGHHILQCFVPLIVQIPPALNVSLTEMITRINTKLPLVGFGLLESHSILYFKHNLLLPHAQPVVNRGIVQETLSLIAYELFTFFGAFADVATEKKTVKEAMDSMPFKHLYA